MENFLNFYDIESNVEILIVYLAKTKFLTNGTLFFIKWGLSDDDIALKFSITLYHP